MPAPVWRSTQRTTRGSHAPGPSWRNRSAPAEAWRTSCVTLRPTSCSRAPWRTTARSTASPWCSAHVAIASAKASTQRQWPRTQAGGAAPSRRRQARCRGSMACPPSGDVRRRRRAGEVRLQLGDARLQGAQHLAVAHLRHRLLADGAAEVEVHGVLEDDAAVLVLAGVELVVLLERDLLAQVQQLVGPAAAQDELDLVEVEVPVERLPALGVGVLVVLGDVRLHHAVEDLAHGGRLLLLVGLEDVDAGDVRVLGEVLRHGHPLLAALLEDVVLHLGVVEPRLPVVVADGQCSRGSVARGITVVLSARIAPGSAPSTRAPRRRPGKTPRTQGPLGKVTSANPALSASCPCWSGGSGPLLTPRSPAPRRACRAPSAPRASRRRGRRPPPPRPRAGGRAAPPAPPPPSAAGCRRRRCGPPGRTGRRAPSRRRRRRGRPCRRRRSPAPRTPAAARTS